MKKISLGTTDLSIAPLIFGGNVFGWTIDEKTSFNLLDKFFDKGFNCIDTADVYSAWASGNKGGESETIIGNWLKKRGRRDDVIIITKVGYNVKNGLSKKHILESIEGSLQRLQTDYIDLYFSHQDDEVTPFEETLQTYRQLIEAGKIRNIGASNFSAKRLEESLKVSAQKQLPAYTVLQPPGNLYDRSFETEYKNVVEKNKLGLITYSSLASGFLSGKYKSEEDFSKSVRGKGMSKFMNDKGKKVLKALNDVAGEHGYPPAAVALAWLIQHPLVTAPIASATKEKQLDELMQAVEINLSEGDLERLNDAGK
ncbi:MAG: aldo/keto reductase [Bacteroidota bacterium]|nr:aldo/keto reductase [Bacteroidota bacterium]